MIMRIIGFNNEIIFNQDTDTVLVIEDNQLYGHIIDVLNNLINNSIDNNEIFIVDDNDELVNISNIELIINPFSIDLFSKKIITALYKNIESEVINDDSIMNSYRKNINNINFSLQDILNDINIDFSFKDEISISNYLKLISLKIDYNSNDTLLNKIINYLEIISELLPNTIIIFTNLFIYLSGNDIEELCKYKKYKHLNILFIENKFDSKYNITKFCIDNDYYEYIE